jgi:hypothetical protein
VVGICVRSVESWKEDSSDTSKSKGHGTEKIMLWENNGGCYPAS